MDSILCWLLLFPILLGMESRASSILRTYYTHEFAPVLFFLSFQQSVKYIVFVSDIRYKGTKWSTFSRIINDHVANMRNLICAAHCFLDTWLLWISKKVSDEAECPWGSEEMINLISSMFSLGIWPRFLDHRYIHKAEISPIYGNETIFMGRMMLPLI